MEAFGPDDEILETSGGKVHPEFFQFHRRLDDLAPSLEAYFTDQFTNEQHPEGFHRLWREIVADWPAISDFVLGVGTGGCALAITAGPTQLLDRHIGFTP